MATPNQPAAPALETWDEETKTEIYELRKDLEVWLSSTKIPNDEQRRLFHLYATGFKMDYYQRFNALPTEGAVVSRWIDADEIDKEPFIALAERYPDPRLDANNFQIGNGILKQFWMRLPQDQRPRFEYLVYSFNTLDDRYRNPKRHQLIIEYWQSNDPYKDENIASGKRHYQRFRARPPPRRKPSGSAGHWFIPGRNPDPETSDIQHVNLEDPRGPCGDRRPAGSRWVFEKTIFQNANYQIGPLQAHRIIHLFALVSEDRRILKRMVVKIMGAPDIDTATRDVNREYYFQRVLSFKGCPNILEAYGSSIRRRDYVPQLGYIYMDYAPFGDLWSLINRLHAEPDKQLPEPYLWLIFRGLAEALLLMETGTAIRRNGPTNENGPLPYDVFHWPQIVNPDIKHMNVMLGEAQDGLYPGFKTAKMIDFGLCVNDGRYNTYNGSHQIGTEGFWPPEQAYPAYDNFNRQPIDVLSEIFNVGLVVLSLMEGYERTFSNVEKNAGRFTHIQGYDRCYSKRLEDLVMRCLEFQRAHRPTLRQLLYQTRIGLERWEKAYGSVDKPEAELPEFATFPIDREEEFLVGQEAPDHWLGMKKRKKRSAEEAGLAPAGPRNPPPAGPPHGDNGPGSSSLAEPPPLNPGPPLRGKTINPWGLQRNSAPTAGKINHLPPEQREKRETSLRKKKAKENGEAAIEQEDNADDVDGSSAQEQPQAETESPKKNGGSGRRKSDPIELSD